MAVEIGKEAPDFELRNTNGEPVKLSDFRGKKNVLLVFYPMAFTRVCTSEFCSLRDVNADLCSDERVEVFGVSVDPIPALRVWRKTEGFQNDFLSDFWPHGKVSQEYGVFVEPLGTSTRGTFLIDKTGTLRWMEIGEFAEARDQQDWKKALDELD